MNDLNYRDILREVLDKKMKANRSYSLRAFARDLAITPSQLSSVLNQKVGLSLARARMIFDRLELDVEVKKHCLLQIQAEHSRSHEMKNVAKAKLLERSQTQNDHHLQRDEFEIVSQWYHFTMIQALALKNAPLTFREQTFWLSQRLGISLVETQQALERLARLNLLTQNETGYRPTRLHTFSPNGLPSAGLRNFHRQFIQKASTAVESQNVKERILNTIVIPVQAGILDQVQEDIYQFQRMIMDKYGRTQQQDGDFVYSLSLQFFRIVEASRENS